MEDGEEGGTRNYRLEGGHFALAADDGRVVDRHATLGGLESDVALLLNAFERPVAGLEV